MRKSRGAGSPEDALKVGRREVLGAAAALSAGALPGCATLGATAYTGPPLEPSCSARFCRQFIADARLGEGLGRCRLGVRG